MDSLMHQKAINFAMGLVLSNMSYASEIELDEEKKQQPIATLSKIVVEAIQTPEVGETIYTEEELKRFASSNKTISEVLQLNPNVQFSGTNQSGAKQGEISAADFSINGATFYDNNIMLDNVSLNNALNPTNGEQNFEANTLSGSSIHSTINTDLICELEVLDSNVSARYGDFTGGVVHAKTCAPKTKIGELHGKISYDYTSSDWTNFSHLSEDEIDDYYEETKSYFQKEFAKQGLSGTVYGNLNDHIGFNLGLSKRWSNIQLPSLLTTTDQIKRHLENDSINLNIYNKINQNHQLKFGFQYENDHRSIDSHNVLNGHVNQDNLNHALEFALDSTFQTAKVSQSLVYQKQKQRKNFDVNDMYVWKSSDAKDWSMASTATEGGYANLAQNLESIEYKLAADFEPIPFLNIAHHFSIGAGYGHYEASWNRLSDSYQYFIPSKFGTDCIKNNAETDPYCDTSYDNGKGQYHTTRVGYQAGSIEIKDDRAHAFFEDTLHFNDAFKARLGVRADYDSLNGNTTFSPRSNFQYRPFANHRLKLTGGWNRYYANKLFAYALTDGINDYNFKETRSSINDEWGNRTAYLSSNVKRSQLDTPFSDESTFAIESQIGNLSTQLKYVHRDFQDQIKRNRISTSPVIDEYDNTGKMLADTYTFSLSNIKPYSLLGTQHRFMFAADYTKKTSNFNDYTDTYNPLTYQQYIVYDGKIIDEANRPASNFNRPWTARLNWNIDFDHIPLKINNFFKLRSSYDAMVLSTIPMAERPTAPDGTQIKQRYDATRLGSAFTWDMRASYDIALRHESKLILGLTIKNLTNQFNQYTTENSAYKFAESGRQFIADLSFQF